MNHEDILCFKCSKFYPHTTTGDDGADTWISDVCPYSRYLCIRCKDYEFTEHLPRAEHIFRACVRWDELLQGGQDDACNYILNNEYTLGMSIWDAAEALKRCELSFGQALDVYNELVRPVYVEFADFKVKNIRLGEL